MVNTKAGVPRPSVSEVVPKSVDTCTWMKRPHCISPALGKQAMERVTGLGPE